MLHYWLVRVGHSSLLNLGSLMYGVLLLFHAQIVTLCPINSFALKKLIFGDNIGLLYTHAPLNLFR